jgi:hypothetical protein
MSPKKMLLERHKEETQLHKQHHAVKPSAGQHLQQQHGAGAGAGGAPGGKARHAVEQKAQVDPTRATRDKLAMSDEDDD